MRVSTAWSRSLSRRPSKSVARSSRPGEAAGLVVMVSQNYRFRAGARTVRRLVASGRSVVSEPLASASCGRLPRPGFGPDGRAAPARHGGASLRSATHRDRPRADEGLGTNVESVLEPFPRERRGRCSVRDGRRCLHLLRWQLDEPRAARPVGEGAGRSRATVGALEWEDDRIVIYPQKPDVSRSRLARALNAGGSSGIKLDQRATGRSSGRSG